MKEHTPHHHNEGPNHTCSWSNHGKNPKHRWKMPGHHILSSIFRLRSWLWHLLLFFWLWFLSSYFITLSLTSTLLWNSFSGHLMISLRSLHFWQFSNKIKQARKGRQWARLSIQYNHTQNVMMRSIAQRITLNFSSHSMSFDRKLHQDCCRQNPATDSQTGPPWPFAFLL